MGKLVKIETSGQYRYKLFNSEKNSDWLGKCEVCGKYSSTVYHQVEEKQAECEGEKFYTQYNCHSLFGHNECLLSNRRA